MLLLGSGFRICRRFRMIGIRWDLRPGPLVWRFRRCTFQVCDHRLGCPEYTKCSSRDRQLVRCNTLYKTKFSVFQFQQQVCSGHRISEAESSPDFGTACTKVRGVEAWRDASYGCGLRIRLRTASCSGRVCECFPGSGSGCGCGCCWHLALVAMI
jgi:hypothetical protein